MEKMDQTLLCLAFNVNKTRFVVGTNERIIVYDTDTCKCKFVYDNVEGGVAHAMIMNEGGLTFFVGTGQNKSLSENNSECRLSTNEF